MGRNLGPLNIKDSYEGLVQISGSLLTDGSGSLIPNLTVTASYATEAATVISASYAQTSTSSSHAVISDSALTATSASYATTASYAENVESFDSGSLLITASISDADITFTKGDGSTFDIQVNNVSSSISASYALTATSASHALVADVALNVPATASYALYAEVAGFATSSLSSSYSNNSDTSISSSYAVTASYAENSGASTLTLQQVTDNGATTTTAITTDTINASGIISRGGFLVTGSANQIRIVDNGDESKYINVSWEENNNSLEFDSSGTVTGATFVIDEATFSETQLSNISASGYISASSLVVTDSVDGNLTISGSVVGEVGVLTDAAGTTTMDCSLGNFFTLAMPAGGTTALTPSNIQAGQTISVKITQNATAALLTFAASVDFEGGTAFTISTGAGEVDVMTFISFDGTTLQATGLTNFS